MSAAKKAKRGRPSLGLEEMVRVPATPEIKALMEQAAKRAGVTAAEAWRRAALTWLAAGGKGEWFAEHEQGSRLADVVKRAKGD